MAKTSFTVHLDVETAKKIEQMREENPDFSRNALIRLAVKEFRLSSSDSTLSDSEISGTHWGHMHDEKFHPFMIKQFKLNFNALHKQLNPDWKRKKSLPYHFPEEYADVKNYSGFHGDGK